MNILYQIIYPGAYLPWCILAVYHMFRYSVLNFLTCVAIMGFAGASISHMEHLEKPVMEWNHLMMMSELCLFCKLILYNTTSSMFLSVTVSAVLFAALHRNDFLTQERIYCVILLFLSSVSANATQLLCCVALIGSTLYRWNVDMSYDSMGVMKQKLIQHFNQKIANVYLVFVLEWSSSSMHWMSLPVILALSSAFQLYAWLTIDTTNTVLDDFYYHLKKLPPNYPIPLDFKHARDHCKIAKKVFKPHQI